MTLIDSHCHLDRLDLTAYQGQLDKALDNARLQGIERFVCVCIDLENFAAVLEIAKAHEDVFASVGVHPTEQESRAPTLEELVTLASHPRVVALGETGLDYYRLEGDLSWQQERLRAHIRAACEVNKPLIIHTRQAREDTIRILREEKANEVGGVLHCFTENWEMATQAIDLGFYVSFSGIVTFKNAVELQEIARRLPLEHMLIETDAPYLAPVPYRGKPNEPAYVRYVAEAIAHLRGISFAEVAEVTARNAKRLFRI